MLPPDMPRFVPLENALNLTGKLPTVLGWFCATRKANNLESCGLEALRMIVDLTTMRIGVMAYWTHSPTSEEEQDLLAGMEFVFGLRMPLNSVMAKDGEQIQVGQSAEVPQRVN